MNDYFVHESRYVDEGAEIGAGTKDPLLSGDDRGAVEYGSRKG